MAWTQSDIDALKTAIGSGILHVAYSDRTITYKSTDDQLKALALMEREVSPTAAQGYRVGSVSKGV